MGVENRTNYHVIDHVNRTLPRLTLDLSLALATEFLTIVIAVFTMYQERHAHHRGSAQLINTGRDTSKLLHIAKHKTYICSHSCIILVERVLGIL